MTTFLYVYPHPDDESFGPAAVMARQRLDGHPVHLLTLTRGGATGQRHELGLSVAEMGRRRYKEMFCVAEVLGLSSLTVLDYPDRGLAGVDPIELEEAVHAQVARVRPDVVVSYGVEGISGHPDHLVTHAVVKRLFCALRRSDGPSPRRLAFAGVPEGAAGAVELHGTPAARIGCVVEADEGALALHRRALDCYETYAEVIARHDPMGVHDGRFVFELFGERPEPALTALEEGLE